MKEGYLKFIEDPEFVSWIFKPTPEIQDYWEKYMNDNPNDKEDLLKAKELLLLLKEREEGLSSNEKDDIFNSLINTFVTRGGEIGRKRNLNTYLKYAAIAILFFSIGSVFVYLQTNHKQQNYFKQLSNLEPAEEAKILLSDGSDIIIKSEKSRINYTKNGKIIVDNDTIQTSPEIESNALSQVIIPYGKRSNVTLSDGTMVWLNAGSRLLYPNRFNVKKREVFLIGEAFFDVAKDHERPFTVRTNDLSIEVLGTKFNLASYADEKMIQTVLAEGKIKLYNDNSFLKKEIVLTPGQMALFNKDSQETRVVYVDTEYYTLWKDGLLKFDGEELSRIVKKLERYYNIKIHFDNPLLGSIRISGKLNLNAEKDHVIKNIADIAAVTIIHVNESAYVMK